ncbi:TPA: 5-methylcytosine-specific restriction endonuclease system specificity protein McrC [Streptococcus suis]|nr:5-methylcytosine-specific restriction endonuclease system specificity protein McrC [Streptococcus suis]
MIPVQNIYYMLSYAFKILHKQEYKQIATEEFKNAADLLAEIMIISLSIQVKRGLGREYRSQTESLSALKGKIHIAESLTPPNWRRKQLVCQYDDFSLDSTMNRIIKASIEILLKADVSRDRKKKLRKLLVFFGEVSKINLHYNQSYQLLMSICYLVVNGLIHTEREGNKKLMNFLDERRESLLYEKFILGYYKHYPQIQVTASQIPWALDDGFGEMLPIMQSDIYLQYKDTILIIDAKYYSSNTQIRFDKRTLHSHNLYQIFTYVKNQAYRLSDSNDTVAGMLLYAKTDIDIQPNQVYQMHGNQISVKNLDLNLQFASIAEQLDDIITSHFLSPPKRY